MAGLFGGKTPATPAPKAPTPIVDEAAIARAKKRSTQRQAASTGRASTILGGALGTEDKLGG